MAVGDEIGIRLVAGNVPKPAIASLSLASCLLPSHSFVHNPSHCLDYWGEAEWVVLVTAVGVEGRGYM